MDDRHAADTGADEVSASTQGREAQVGRGRVWRVHPRSARGGPASAHIARLEQGEEEVLPVEDPVKDDAASSLVQQVPACPPLRVSPCTCDVLRRGGIRRGGEDRCAQCGVRIW